MIVTASPGQADVGLRSAVSSTHGAALQRTEAEASSLSLPHEFEAFATTAQVTLLPAVQLPIETSRWNVCSAPGASEPEKTCTPPTVTV